MKRSPLKPSGPLKRTALRKVSDKRRKALAVGKRAARATDYLDGQGVAFSVHHLFVDRGAKVEIVKNAGLLRMMHERFGDCCWNCGATASGMNRIEAHHMEPSVGRIDVRCNLMMLCGACHAMVNTSELPRPMLHYLKWLHDPDGTDWAQLARLRGVQRLPDLICD